MKCQTKGPSNAIQLKNKKQNRYELVGANAIYDNF